MKYTNYLISLLFIAFCSISCEQESIEDIESKTAVVEGYLHAGQPVDSIFITQTFSYAQTDTNLKTLDNLEVDLIKGDQSYPIFPMGNGLYQNEAVIIEAGESYTLEFGWQGTSVSATTYIPELKEVEISTEEVEMEKIEFNGGFPGGGFPGMDAIDPIDIRWENIEGDYYYVVIKNIEPDPEYVNEIIAQFDDDNGGRRRFTFISAPEITDVYSINPRRTLIQYGTHQIIVYRVNPEYAALYETSGNSTLSLVQPPTNVENGLGLLTGVSSDTVYLEVVRN